MMRQYDGQCRHAAFARLGLPDLWGGNWTGPLAPPERQSYSEVSKEVQASVAATDVGYERQSWSTCQASATVNSRSGSMQDEGSIEPFMAPKGSHLFLRRALTRLSATEDLDHCARIEPMHAASWHILIAIFLLITAASALVMTCDLQLQISFTHDENPAQ